MDKFYRMMDALDEDCIARLQSIVSDEVLGLMGGALDVLFFDATTLSFASEKEDALRRFSKDGKPHRVQVVFADEARLAGGIGTLSRPYGRRTYAGGRHSIAQGAY